MSGQAQLLRLLLISVLLLVACVISEPASTAADDDELAGWQLQQKSRIGGALELFVCPSAVRIRFPKSGLVVGAVAPWKEAFFYCKRTGHQFKTPFAKLSSPYSKTMDLFDGFKLSQLKVAPSGTQESLGIPCKLYIEPAGEEKRMKDLCKRGEITARMPASLKYLVTDYFKTPPQVASLICRFFVLPELTGVPVQCVYSNVNHESVEELTTSSCKAAKSCMGDIVPPKGLKMVTDARLVLVPDNRDDDAMGLMLLDRR